MQCAGFNNIGTAYYKLVPWYGRYLRTYGMPFKYMTYMRALCIQPALERTPRARRSGSKGAVTVLVEPLLPRTAKS